MDILVIGGSYFLGKHFVSMAASDNNVTVFNRGTQPLNMPDVTEIKGDRHDSQALGLIKRQHYDAVVDFCAYDKGDIGFIFDNLKADFDRYVFISTCDVYERGLNKMLDEDAPFETRDFGGEAGSYISGKAALEKEVKACAEKSGKSCISIRPAFIYGPYNYAPREGIYFHWIKSAGQILHPSDATGEFQMVYVKDVAKAVINAIKTADTGYSAYNLAPAQMITYDIFADALEEAADIPFTKVPLSVNDINEKQIPLPFPLTREESNYYDGSKALSLIESYTPLTEGLKETFTWNNAT